MPKQPDSPHTKFPHLLLRSHNDEWLISHNGFATLYINVLKSFKRVMFFLSDLFVMSKLLSSNWYSEIPFDWKDIVMLCNKNMTFCCVFATSYHIGCILAKIYMLSAQLIVQLKEVLRIGLTSDFIVIIKGTVIIHKDVDDLSTSETMFIGSK